MKMATSSTNQHVNSAWVRYRSIGYLRGRGISFGIGPSDIYPDEALDLGKYSLNVDVLRHTAADVCDKDLSIFARASLDHVFCGDRYLQTPELLPQLVEKLREGGHFILHLLGEHSLADVTKTLASLGYWQAKDTYQRDGQFLGIWKLLGRQRRGVVDAKPVAAKRACICRYGAIGDMIMISPLIHQLHDDGYEVTLNVTPYCAEVIKHNPYVSNIVLQERDAIPNSELGHYWNEWKGDYARYINLSESIEGKLIKVEGRRDFYTTKAWREQCTGHVNYYDQTMRLGGYPDALGRRGELYFSRAEEREAEHTRAKFKDRFLMLWALKGSSYHKVYPLLAPVLSDWLNTHPKAFCITTGSAAEAGLQFDHPQVFKGAGTLALRDVFALTKLADLVAGPETSVTNAASCFATPKLTLLSHSSHDNLCKYWEGDYCLEPEGIACYPCHQLHYTMESCPTIQIKDRETDAVGWEGPACAGMGVSPARLQARLSEIYTRWEQAQV